MAFHPIPCKVEKTVNKLGIKNIILMKCLLEVIEVNKGCGGFLHVQAPHKEQK